MPIIQLLGKGLWEDCHEFQASLGYKIHTCTERIQIVPSPVGQTQYFL